MSADRLFVSELYQEDSIRRVNAVDSIYRVHGVDSLSVSTTLTWYADHPEDLALLFDSTVALLEHRAAALSPRDTVRR